MPFSENHVAEMQGLYGPFTISERVVQKIWLRGDFSRERMVLTDGRPLEIRFGGTWNLLGGPDFHRAELVIGGRRTVGDIEIHFHAADWRAHGHEFDRAYDRVALHVVLFPPDPGVRASLRGDGAEIPTLVLLPLLHRDLEEYASDDALEMLTEQDEWEKLAELAALPPAELAGTLRQNAADRWEQKVRFARVRIDKLGWQAAAHHTALEILGYRYNRTAMLSVATRYPLEAWREGVDAESIYREGGVEWQTQGIRPANHPLARLRQYRRWMTAWPDWPDRLCDHPWSSAGPSAGSPSLPTPDTRAVRHDCRLKELREALARDIAGDAVGGTRFDNLVCDGFLPLLAAQGIVGPGHLWFHWYLGDAPVQVRRGLSKLGIAGRPTACLCHGWAQGLLGWLLEREARASRWPGQPWPGA